MQGISAERLFLFQSLVRCYLCQEGIAPYRQLRRVKEVLALLGRLHVMLGLPTSTMVEQYQMTDIQAAVGREQLKKLPKFIQRREEIFKLYQKNGLELIDVKQDEQEKLKPVRYRAILKTNNPDKTISLLKKVNVESCVPVEDWELLGKGSNFKNAFYFTKNTVSLPIYPNLSEQEVESIIRKLKKIILS